MAKEKFTLDQLKSEAKVTTLQATEMQAVKGGIVAIAPAGPPLIPAPTSATAYPSKTIPQSEDSFF
jgi:hypothetical protein